MTWRQKWILFACGAIGLIAGVLLAMFGAWIVGLL